MIKLVLDGKKMGKIKRDWKMLEEKLFAILLFSFCQSCLLRGFPFCPKVSIICHRSSPFSWWKFSFYSSLNLFMVNTKFVVRTKWYFINMSRSLRRCNRPSLASNGPHPKSLHVSLNISKCEPSPSPSPSLTFLVAILHDLEMYSADKL